jgi:hypothetical protein
VKCIPSETEFFRTATNHLSRSAITKEIKRVTERDLHTSFMQDGLLHHECGRRMLIR